MRSEVEKAIKMFKNNKSCGIDGIPAKMIKAGGSKIVDESGKSVEKYRQLKFGQMIGVSQ